MAIVVPEHNITPKHEIMHKDDVNQLIEDLNLESIFELPRIRNNDPVCVWIGAKPWDVLRIYRQNIQGKSIMYRLVIGIS